MYLDTHAHSCILVHMRGNTCTYVDQHAQQH